MPDRYMGSLWWPCETGVQGYPLEYASWGFLMFEVRGQRNREGRAEGERKRGREEKRRERKHGEREGGREQH
jgi:hypothetical protein